MTGKLDRKSRRIAWATLLAACLGAFAAMEFWPFVQNKLVDGPTSRVDAAAGVQLAGMRDFRGIPRPELVSQESSGASRVVLVSTSPGSSPREGAAQLGMNAHNAVTYGAGALLLNGSRLTEIYPDHVMLERDGRMVPLYRIGTAGERSATDDEILSVRSVPLPGTAVINRPAAAPEGQLTDYIRPNPVYEAGRLRGFELYAGANSAAFTQLGLVAGDIVVAVDDVAATDPSQVMDSFQQLMSGSALMITVERHGKLERVAVDGAAIAAQIARAQNVQALPAGVASIQ